VKCGVFVALLTKVTRLQDDELAIVVANEPAALAIHCGDTDDDDGEVIPIEVYCHFISLVHSVNLIQVYTLDLQFFYFFAPLWTGNSGKSILNNHDITVPLDIASSLLWVLGLGRPSLGWCQQHPCYCRVAYSALTKEGIRIGKRLD
jgi:hypothetical protein